MTALPIEEDRLIRCHLVKPAKQREPGEPVLSHKLRVFRQPERAQSGLVGCFRVVPEEHTAMGECEKRVKLLLERGLVCGLGCRHAYLTLASTDWNFA